MFDPRGEAINQEQEKRRQEKGCQSKNAIHGQHHREHARHDEGTRDHGQQRVGQELLDDIDVFGDAGNRVAGPLTLMHAQRQRLDVCEQRRAQVKGDFLAGALEREHPPVREQPVQQRDENNQHADDHEKARLIEVDAEGRRVTAEQRVDHQLQRPRFGEVDRCRTYRPQRGQRQAGPTWPEVRHQARKDPGKRGRWHLRVNRGAHQFTRVIASASSASRCSRPSLRKPCTAASTRSTRSAAAVYQASVVGAGTSRMAA